MLTIGRVARFAPFPAPSNFRKMSSKVSINAENTVTITPEQPSATVIFSHGLGDSAHGWADAMQEVAKDLPHVKFVLPTATPKPVTLNMGMSMPSWYDIRSLDKVEDDSADGIEDSRALIQSLIDKEVAAGIPQSRIVLGGFSQGGALSLFTGFQMSVALAGVLGMSCYLPNASQFTLNPAAKQIPLLMCHGDSDMVVNFQYGKMSKERLEELGVSDVTFKVYSNMGHEARMEELDDVKDWLKRVLPPQ